MYVGLENYSSFLSTYNKTGSIEMEDAIGATGQVYLRIPGDGVGQVTVEVWCALRTYNAKSDGENEIPTDAFIEVVGVLGKSW